MSAITPAAPGKLVLFSCFVCATIAGAGDYYVNNRTGNDAFDGRSKAVAGDSGPFRSIAKAVAAVKPGDTVHLTPTGKVYRESVILIDRNGEPDKPITVDGHGAWLTGSEHCAPDGWQPCPGGEPGTLVRSDLAGKSPWFSLCIDGEMTWGVRDMDILRPGEFCFDKADRDNTVYFLCPKGLKLEADTVQATLKDGTTVSLDPAKWHASHSRNRSVRRHRGLPEPPTRLMFEGQPVESVQCRQRLEPGQWTRVGQDVYYRPPAGKSIADVRMLTVPRASTVALQGRCSHIAIKNLNAVYTANDGYNIHGRVKNARFVNCNAFYSFDEGFSSHDVCETELDGAIYVHCDNGIANVNQCVSVIRNVICDSARSVGFLLTTSDSPKPQVIDNLILIDSPSQYSVTRSNVDNLLIVRGGQAMNLGTDVNIKRATSVGTNRLVRLGKASSASLEDCLLGAARGVVHLRSEDISTMLKLTRVTTAAGATVEWGETYPWHREPMTEWLADRAGKSAQDCTETDLAVLDPLLEGKAPAPDGTRRGCTPELYQRYVEYVQKRDQLLETALRMAWGE